MYVLCTFFLIIRARSLDRNNSSGHARPRPTLRSGFPLIVCPALIPLLAERPPRGLHFIFPEPSMPARCNACVGRATGSLRHGSSSHRFVDLAEEEDDTRSHVNRSFKWRAVSATRSEMKNQIGNARWKILGDPERLCEISVKYLTFNFENCRYLIIAKLDSFHSI